MPGIDIEGYAEFESFAAEWQDFTAVDIQMLWDLAGQLEEDELIIRIPEWLAEEKTGYVDGATPTVFIGRITEETDKAIRLTDSAAARSVMKLGHLITKLEEGLAKANDGRRPRLENRLNAKRQEFEDRGDVAGLREEWLPKSQIEFIGQRTTEKQP